MGEPSAALTSMGLIPTDAALIEESRKKLQKLIAFEEGKKAKEQKEKELRANTLGYSKSVPMIGMNPVDIKSARQISHEPAQANTLVDSNSVPMIGMNPVDTESARQ